MWGDLFRVLFSLVLLNINDRSSGAGARKIDDFSKFKIRISFTIKSILSYKTTLISTYDIVFQLVFCNQYNH